MKLDTKVALFYKLKMLTRAVVWGQVKTESCVARAIVTSIYLVACIMRKLPSAGKKTLKSSYNILTPNIVKIRNKGFRETCSPST